MRAALRNGSGRVRACLQVILVSMLSALAMPLGAQGVTSAAVHGRVVGRDQGPVEGARVRITLAASGAHWDVLTGASGGYFLEHVEPGGPYVIDVRAIGFAPVRRTGMSLALGERHRADFVLAPVATTLDTVIVTDRDDRLINAGRTGSEHIVSAEELRSLPNLARDLNPVGGLAPLAVLRPLGGISIGGQNQGFNNLQVDGGVNADLYLGRSPGGASPSGALPEVLPHAISIETVREFQVLTAPFDVRFGNFAGGLLNAVTRSGTNHTEASVFGFVQDGHLAGRNTAGRRLDFTTWQFGGSASGPIVRDRIHYFVNADLQERTVPDRGPFLVEPGTKGITAERVDSFAEILARRYKIDGGTILSEGRLPAQDLFGKITAQLSGRHRVELSQHYARARREGFMDVGRTPDSVALSSATGLSRSTALTSRLIWSALLRDHAQSEMIVSYARLRDSCTPSDTFPLIQVKVDSTFGLIAGPNSVCPTTDVDQQALELTGNVTVGVGSHLLTIGSHTQLLQFRDPLLQVSAGRWDFASLSTLEAGTPTHYDRGLPAPPPRSAGVDFGVLTLGGYVQDRWTPSPRLSLTFGVRFDVPFMRDTARTNPALLARGVDTGRLPASTPLWSPRIGFSYDWHGDGRAFVRGGAGLFTGPPPYRWLGNAYRDTGDEMLVNCDRPETPAFTPFNQPASCVSGGGTSRRLSFFEPGFRFPQNLKLALGLDRRLALGTVASVDVLYTRAVHQIYISSANLYPSSNVASGEGRRRLYGGTPRGARGPIPTWRDTSSLVTELYRISNSHGDHSVSVAVQARREFGDNFGVHAAYAYTRARDRMSMVNFPARANYSNTPLGGEQADRPLGPSFFETPHKLSLAASIGRADRTQLTLVYSAASQPPFTYVVNGDVNGDGIGGAGSLKNDIVFVPVNAESITLSNPEEYEALDAFIEASPCLREQRGRIMARGSCRNPWLGMLSGRVTTRVPGKRLAQRLEIIADVINIPNLLHGGWGLQRDITTGPSVTLLALDGWDALNERGRYSLRLPPQRLVDDASSRWRVQIGAKYHLTRREPASSAPR